MEIHHALSYTRGARTFEFCSATAEIPGHTYSRKSLTSLPCFPAQLQLHFPFAHKLESVTFSLHCEPTQPQR